MAKGTSVPGAVFLLFLLAFSVNPLLALVKPRWSLNRGELLVIFIMMAMASPIPTLFASKLLGLMTAPFYFAGAENDWRALILPHIPDWLMPNAPALLEHFYEGGGAKQPIPWSLWISALLVWMPLVWAVFIGTIAAMVLMRKQWVEHERLIYPLIQVPLAMTEPGSPGERLSPFFKNPVMWGGFALPAIWGTLHGLYSYL